MIARHVSEQDTRKELFAKEYSSSRTLALFTESIVLLLSNTNTHQAFMDLVSLMGQTFPLAAPALYLQSTGSQARVYSMLEKVETGDREALKMLSTKAYSYHRVLVGGHPPIIQKRMNIPLMNTPSVKVILCINSGMHDEIFAEWVKILAPAVTKLMDHEVLMHMAYRDGLTSLLNYRAFDEMLRSETDRAGRYETTFSIMMIDIDYFKKVNDDFGHPVGDVVLKDLADALIDCVRKSDRVFRYGGEEFAIILPHTGLEKARRLAERIRYTIEKMSFIGGLHITVSIGIGQYSDGLTPGDLVKQADEGLYLAKNRGRNRVGTAKDMI